MYIDVLMYLYMRLYEFRHECIRMYVMNTNVNITCHRNIACKLDFHMNLFILTMNVLNSLHIGIVEGMEGGI
jgi:hypothetical protein